MFDGRTHLVKQGWKGTGHPLKAGGRSRPVVIAQKKTLGGIGKDRDESFAFWDHLYDVAAKTVKLKLPGDGSSTDSDEEAGHLAPTIHRTRTGIPSNRRPTALPTPSSSKSPSPSPQPTSTSLITLAKREAARRVLYSRFSRGPVITQETLESEFSKNDGIAPPVAPPVVLSSTEPSNTVSGEPFATSPAADAQGNKYADKLAKEERKKARIARRQAKEERRLAKAVRKEARAAKRLRKVERAAKKAAKLEKKQQIAPIAGEAPATQTNCSIEHEVGEDKAVRKEKKRKRDGK